MTRWSCTCLLFLLFKVGAGGLWDFGRSRGIYVTDKYADVRFPGFADGIIHPERLNEFTGASEPVTEWIRKYLALGPGFLKPESTLNKIRPFYVSKLQTDAIFYKAEIDSKIRLSITEIDRHWQAHLNIR